VKIYWLVFVELQDTISWNLDTLRKERQNESKRQQKVVKERVSERQREKEEEREICFETEEERCAHVPYRYFLRVESLKRVNKEIETTEWIVQNKFTSYLSLSLSLSLHSHTHTDVFTNVDLCNCYPLTL
jgi:hypothetical protein